MMENRVAMFSRLSKLHGKLELMLTQVIDLVNIFILFMCGEILAVGVS